MTGSVLCLIREKTLAKTGVFLIGARPYSGMQCAPKSNGLLFEKPIEWGL